jgi:hypothetical protein
MAEAEHKQEPGASRTAAEPDPGAMVAPTQEVKKPAPPAPKPARMPRRAASPPPPPAQQGLLSALPAPLDQPLVLAGIALVLIVVIALVVLRRRGGAEAEEPITPFSAGEPFSVDEQPEASLEPEAEEPATDFAGAPAGPSTEGSLFDQPVETAEPEEEPQAEPGAPEEVPVTPAVAADSAPELERRLARLEERLDELVDGNDRLARQVAAQTEELRVQRAAIARTQRVLRDLTRTDEATEPVPKT